MRAAIKATEIMLILTQNQTYKQPWPRIQGSLILDCIASVFSRVTARKLEREQKKMEGVGEKTKRLPANPTPLDISRFGSFVN